MTAANYEKLYPEKGETTFQNALTEMDKEKNHLAHIELSFSILES